MFKQLVEMFYHFLIHSPATTEFNLSRKTMKKYRLSSVELSWFELIQGDTIGPKGSRSCALL